MSVPTARKKLDVAHQEVRDEIEAEQEKKEKERLARIEKHNQAVEKREKERKKGTLGNIRKAMREALFGNTPETTDKNKR